MKIKIENLKNILNKNIKDKNIINNILNEYIINLIPPGTKGNIRGGKFNLYIKKILEKNFINNEYILKFEENHPIYKTDEKPDWYIEYNDITIIGLNQLSLWGGGQQINRGYKYMNLENTNKVKYLCVVAYNTIIKTEKSKLFKLFNNCLSKNRICYPKDLIYKINLLLL